MKILHFEDLGDTESVVTNAVVLVLGECQISMATYVAPSSVKMPRSIYTQILLIRHLRLLISLYMNLFFITCEHIH